MTDKYITYYNNDKQYEFNNKIYTGKQLNDIINNPNIANRDILKDTTIVKEVKTNSQRAKEQAEELTGIKLKQNKMQQLLERSMQKKNNNTNINWNDKNDVKSYIASRAKELGFTDNQIPYVLAVVSNESGFNPNAHNKTSKEDSYGLFQINTKAHPDYKGGLDPVQNIDYGLNLLSGHLKRTNGNMHEALRYYNGYVKNFHDYANKVENIAKNFIGDYNNGKIALFKTGNVTGAAAPVQDSIPDDEGLGQQVSDTVAGNVNIAEQGIKNYASSPYDARMAMMLRALREKEMYDRYNKVVQETPINLTPQQVADVAQPFQAAQNQMVQNTQNAASQVQGLTGSERYQPYEQKLRNAYEEQISRLQGLNPYTQLADVAKVNPIDIDMQNKMNKVYDTMNVINSAMGLNSTPTDFAALERQRALQNRAAQIYNATGLTPEEFLQQGALNYNNTGGALQARNQYLANILNQAMQGDVQAIQTLGSIYNNLNANITTNAGNQASAIHNAKVDQMNLADKNFNRNLEMLKYIGAGDVPMIQEGGAQQRANTNAAASMYNTGLTSGTNAAGNILNYERGVLNADTQQAPTPITSNQAISGMANTMLADPTANVNDILKMQGEAYIKGGANPNVIQSFFPLNPQ